jgi:hypothetical protein
LKNDFIRQAFAADEEFEFLKKVGPEISDAIKDQSEKMAAFLATVAASNAQIRTILDGDMDQDAQRRLQDELVEMASSVASLIWERRGIAHAVEQLEIQSGIIRTNPNWLSSYPHGSARYTPELAVAETKLRRANSKAARARGIE